MRKFLLALVGAAVFGCGGPQGDTDTDELNVDLGVTASAITGSVAIGSVLEATANVNLRSGASTTNTVLAVVPSGSRVTTVETTSPVNGFYKVKYGTLVGYSSGTYYRLVATPATSAIGTLMGTYQMTHYWLAQESNHTATPTVSAYTSSCSKIDTVASGFFQELKMEGSGKLTDGRVLNYAGSCGCATSPCFSVMPSSAPWGMGANGNPLIPFRSIAVDRSRIALGTWLYVKQLDGQRMPGTAPTGGFVHNGCVRADDVGGAIDGSHIDFMSGTKTWAYDLISRIPENITLYRGGTRCTP